LLLVDHRFLNCFDFNQQQLELYERKTVSENILFTKIMSNC
jgi:hypothetical protein